MFLLGAQALHRVQSQERGLGSSAGTSPWFLRPTALSGALLAEDRLTGLGRPCGHRVCVPDGAVSWESWHQPSGLMVAAGGGPTSHGHRVAEGHPLHGDGGQRCCHVRSGIRCWEGLGAEDTSTRLGPLVSTGGSEMEIVLQKDSWSRSHWDQGVMQGVTTGCHRSHWTRERGRRPCTDHTWLVTSGSASSAHSPSLAGWSQGPQGPGEHRSGDDGPGREPR